MKRNGREPACATRVMNALFERGDLVRAGDLNTASTPQPAAGVFGGLKASLGRYLWSGPASDLPGPEDGLVSTAALSAACERANALLGPIATSEIHTVKSFADALTGGNERDAEAVIASLAAAGSASILHAPATADSEALRGVRLGKGAPAPADTGLLRTKHARERLQKVAAHLAADAEAARVEAVAAAKRGDRAAALVKVQRKTALEKKLAGTRGTLSRLTDVLHAVDEAESNKEAVGALEVGMDALRLTNEGGVTADRIDDIAANFDEEMAKQQDMRVALEQLATSNEVDNAAFEDELDALMREDALNDPSLNVPAEKPGEAVAAAEAAAAEKSAAEKEAEAELEKLLAEAGVEGLPVPGAVGDGEKEGGRIAAPLP